MAMRNLRREHLLRSQMDVTPDEQTNLADFTDRLSMAMGRLSVELREGWKAREENQRLRQENEELRDCLSACVESCERFLGPALDHEDFDEDGDRSRVRAALAEGRRLLDTGVAVLPGPRVAQP